MKKFSKTHEWTEIDNDVATIGLSDFAQNSLGDIVYVSLPAVGSSVSIGKSFADVESVKAVSEVFSSVEGTVEEVNSELEDNPQLINESAETAWLIRVRFTSVCQELLTQEEYQEMIKEEQ